MGDGISIVLLIQHDFQNTRDIHDIIEIHVKKTHTQHQPKKPTIKTTFFYFLIITKTIIYKRDINKS